MPKPHSTLLLLGPAGHGKTRLAAGLRRVGGLRRVEGSMEPTDERVGEREVRLFRSVTMSFAFVPTELESTRRRYTLLDPAGPQAVRKRLIAGPLAGLAAIDLAVLVVDAGLRFGPEFKGDLRVLRRVGVPGLVVFLNLGVAEEPEFVDLVELELRAALCEVGFAGDEVPVVRGAIGAICDGAPAGIEAAVVLYEALDQQVTRVVDERPRVVVARVVASRGDETEVEGRVVRGALEPDDRVETVGVTPTRMAQLVSVVDASHEGGGAADVVRLTLRGVTADDMRGGQVLSLPGVFTPVQRFEAEILFFAGRAREAEELQLVFFDAVGVGGLVRPLKESDGYEIELATGLALAAGDGFGLLAAGVAIGVGVVVAVRGARKRRRGGLSPTGVALALVDSLHRGDRPDVAASLLLPPDDVLQATAALFAEEMRPHFRSGRILLELIDDGRQVAAERREFAEFDYGALLRRPGDVEYIGPREDEPWERGPRTIARGETAGVYAHVEGQASGRREYPINAGLTMRRFRFQIAVTRQGERREMIVALWIAEFAVKRGVWYLFGFDCPSSWRDF